MKRKINSFSFLGVAVRHHKALAKLKQQNQKKIHQIAPNLSQIGLLYKQHPALV